MKTAIITLIIIIVLVGIGGYFYLQNLPETPGADELPDLSNPPLDPIEPTTSPTGTTTPNTSSVGPVETIGVSAGGHDLKAYHYGNGTDELLFIGGIHGGYSWNTVLLSYQLMDYLEANPDAVPENVRVTVVPVMNPDGLNETVGSTGRFEASAVPASLEATIPGRFNATKVDLNRNFDCEWQTSGTWQSRTVSGGTAAFSEPEAKAIRDYVNSHNLVGAVAYYSAAGGVFASSCGGGVPAEVLAMTNLYADASGYPAYEEFDFYEITGDLVNWLTKSNVPSVSILLSTHEGVEWDRNRRGVEALLDHFAE